MGKYIPTHTLDATPSNITMFVDEHSFLLWKIWTPFIPYVIFLYFLDALFLQFYPDSFYAQFEIFSIIADTYFGSLLAVAWHQLVIKGEENFEAPNPFKPSATAFTFIILVILMNGFYLGTLTFLGYLIISIAAVLLITGILFYFTYRISFIFPSVAVGRKVSLKKSYEMTQGTFWEFLLSMIFASIVLYIQMVILSLGWFFLIAILIPGYSNAQHIFNFFFMVPMIIYFYPKLTAIGVTALSNYYLYALEKEQKSAP